MQFIKGLRARIDNPRSALHNREGVLAGARGRTKFGPTWNIRLDDGKMVEVEEGELAPPKIRAFVECMCCVERAGKSGQFITLARHVLISHAMTVTRYQEVYPGAPIRVYRSHRKEA